MSKESARKKRKRKEKRRAEEAKRDAGIQRGRDLVFNNPDLKFTSGLVVNVEKGPITECTLIDDLPELSNSDEIPGEVQFDIESSK